jgi:CubicO group peptidase (beta-lactamase class C family)
MVVAVIMAAAAGCASPPAGFEADVRADGANRDVVRLAESVAAHLPNAAAAAAIVVVDDSGAYYALAGNNEIERGTAFEFASVTKVMTASLMALLAESGHLDLDAAVERYLPEDVGSESWSRVTSRDLLTHTSGADSFPPNLRPVWLWLTGRANDPFSGYTTSRLEEGIQGTGLTSDPGWQYSNYGFAVLGYVAEQITGRSYADLLEERVLAPAGMRSAAVDRWAGGDVAPPLTRSGAPSNAFSFGAMAPAGAVRGTAEDAAAWLSTVIAACAGEDLLARAICTATRPTLAGGEWPYQMGLGWFRATRQDGVVLWHNGGTAGAASFLGVLAGEGVGLAILTNVSGLREIDTLGLEFLGGPAPSAGN